ncbi:MAG: hypothetical protein LBK00_07450 [Treponema sp.]|jgi:hypothetical protein|nr:hypothetical protein [Treponema sp.]
MPPLTRPLTLFLFFITVSLDAKPLASETWGFQLDLPEGYEYIAGDGKNRFSFSSDNNTVFDLVVYDGTYLSVEALAADIGQRLGNQGETDPFIYRRKNAVLMELRFMSGNVRNEGWGLCVELDGEGRAQKPLLLALAYGLADRDDLQMLHFSALDSLAPTVSDVHAPGPITEYAYPRGDLLQTPVAGINIQALVYENDAEAAQALVDREFEILRQYLTSPLGKDAQLRFYRMIYRDSFERLANIAFTLERTWNIPAQEPRSLASKALEWTQAFTYERDFMGSDFVNPVSAALEGRGDCDSRALLWAIVLEQANIPAAIMVSPYYSHAMGLADLIGEGVRFELAPGENWLVAETTSHTSIGVIDKSVSDKRHWWGVPLE